MKIIPGTEEVVQTKKVSKGCKTELEKLFEQKKILQTQLTQIQTMLYLIDFYISEELLQDIDIDS